jgi:hypothetical protein
MLAWFVGLFRGRRHEAEMNDELRAHLDALIERNRVSCMSPEEARLAALRAFGRVEQLQERAREERRSVCGRRPDHPEHHHPVAGGAASTRCPDLRGRRLRGFSRGDDARADLPCGRRLSIPIP